MKSITIGRGPYKLRIRMNWLPYKSTSRAAPSAGDMAAIEAELENRFAAAVLAVLKNMGRTLESARIKEAKANGEQSLYQRPDDWDSGVQCTGIPEGSR